MNIENGYFKGTPRQLVSHERLIAQVSQTFQTQERRVVV